MGQWDKKAIKISVSQHHCLSDTNDLVKFRIDGMNFNICWENRYMTRLYSVTEPVTESLCFFLCIEVIVAHALPRRLSRINTWLCFYVTVHEFLLLSCPTDRPAVLLRRPAKRHRKGGVTLPCHPLSLISGPDKSPLLLAEQHLCPPMSTAEICP